MRTALSRTSGEYRFDVFITPSSQSMESPVKSGRFRLSSASTYTGCFLLDLIPDSAYIENCEVTKCVNLNQAGFVNQIAQLDLNQSGN
jgi:hypothetical protein